MSSGKSLYEAIPEGKARGWKGYDLITGEEVAIPPLFMLENSRIGMQVHYGNCVLSEKIQYDAPYIKESGGPIIMPYYVTQKHELFVALVEQDRKLMGGQVLNAIRGMKRIDEDPKVAAAREAGEEVEGINAQDPIEVPGQSMNMNSALFDTVHGGSVSVFALPLYSNEIIGHSEGDGMPHFGWVSEVVDEDENGVPNFKENVQAISNTVERLLSCQLVSIWEAIESPCGMTAVAAGRLLNYLRTEKNMEVRFVK